VEYPSRRFISICNISEPQRRIPTYLTRNSKKIKINALIFGFYFEIRRSQHQNMRKNQLEKLIQELELYSKQGESYSDESGRFGWRNPIRTDTGILLRSFVLAIRPKRILELGTAHGLSALYLAGGWSDHESGCLDTIEFDPEVAAAAQERMDSINLPVKVLAGDASVIIPTLKGRYDMVFFDAQKSLYHEHFLQLLEAGLIGTGTVILADNVIDRQHECQGFLDWFSENDVPHSVIPTECGLLIARLP